MPAVAKLAIGCKRRWIKSGIDRHMVTLTVAKLIIGRRRRGSRPLRSIPHCQHERTVKPLRLIVDGKYRRWLTSFQITISLNIFDLCRFFVGEGSGDRPPTRKVNIDVVARLLGASLAAGTNI